MIRYILFAFVPDPASDAGRIVAALTLSSESPTPQLSVYERSGWDQDYAREDNTLEMAKETLDDWKTLSSAEAEAIFEDLMDASMGPLRAEKSGSATPSEIKKILSETLGVEIAVMNEER